MHDEFYIDALTEGLECLKVTLEEIRNRVRELRNLENLYEVHKELVFVGNVMLMLVRELRQDSGKKGCYLEYKNL